MKNKTQLEPYVAWYGNETSKGQEHQQQDEQQPYIFAI